MVRVWSKEEQIANRDRFWSMLRSGVSVTSACEDLGVSRRTGHRWILDTRGRAPVKKPELTGRYLSVDERIRIADLKIAGESVRSIARQLGRAPSTISRELRRNHGRSRYGPHTAQRRAVRRRCRPKEFKLDHPGLRDVVQSKLCLKWSPEQISLHLSERFGDHPEMNVAFETIYTALYREHREIAAASGISIFFCKPHSPWQRGTNENTNGLIRQYFPKSTDLNTNSAERVAAVARELNERPRKTLHMRTPQEIFTRHLDTTPATVATTT
jgi:IS30 family transposase